MPKSTASISLARRCRDAFEAVRRTRGQAIARSGRIRIDEESPESVRALVRGSRPEPYVVEMDWSWAESRRVLWVSCGCPDFADGQLCKHLWGTILVLDEARIGGRVPGRARLELISDQPDEDEEESPDLGPAMQAPSGIIPWTVSGGRPADERGIPGGRFPDERDPSGWRDLFDPILKPPAAEPPEFIPRPRAPRGAQQTWYLVDLRQAEGQGRLVVSFFQGGPTGDPGEKPLKPLRLSREDLDKLPDGDDRELLALLLGNQPEDADAGWTTTGPWQPRFSRSLLTPPMIPVILPRLCATGRFGWVEGSPAGHGMIRPLAWDDGPPWRPALDISGDETRRAWLLRGRLARPDAAIDIEAPMLLLRDGLVFFRDRVARLEAGRAFEWAELLRRHGAITVPVADQDELARRLALLPPEMLPGLPAGLCLEEVAAEPRPRITIQPGRSSHRQAPLVARIAFDYLGQIVEARSPDRVAVDMAGRRAISRDRTREAALLAALPALGFGGPGPEIAREADARIARRRLPEAVRGLLATGWSVEAEGRRLRLPGTYRIAVTSGVDWFDLDGRFDFDGQDVGLPELLAAVRRGDHTVRLGDGSHGLLPEEWLERYASLKDLGRVQGDRLRFAPSQAVILEALLAAEPALDVDETFERVRRKLGDFRGVGAVEAPAGFVGTLRGYQKDGLGWTHFLADFRFGGCLADDMGLGKTIQVLARLEERRTRQATPEEPRLPSLVVVPRSLVHNWIMEAARFTPRLRVLDYTGLDRAGLLERFAEHDLVVTTYGTVRRDILKLREISFDYAILDEAQAIKNAGSLAAKASRLLRARHRLALSGTPVENHLGELWSIFEFLNPGMLGGSKSLRSLSVGRPEDATVDLVARALRPFILRRTKEQVLKELPPKTEQTVYCEMDHRQRRLYDELRLHYQTALSRRIEQSGFDKARMHVLEALLRLRQAACHPGLIDRARLDDPSAKLDTLWEQLQEVFEEGHKALVFSQFTSLLAILRRRFDRERVPYEYLDGRTVKRAERVARFQQDAACPAFLISLKAGGQGLNLTAADYVFILDPWWNPAAEAQAVDRAHRIGQTRRVFAYRLIARDTVEEKILELQRGKRRLADAIVSADAGVLKRLKAEDLKFLLG